LGKASNMVGQETGLMASEKTGRHTKHKILELRRDPHCYNYITLLTRRQSKKARQMTSELRRV
jgi:hypothetical protein